MLRPLALALSLLPVFALALAFGGCNAEVDEGCLSGPCGTPWSGQQDGTGNEPDCGATPETGDYPCEVYQVVQAKCNTCHTEPPQKGAPFALLTYELTRLSYGSKQRWEHMRDDIKRDSMPPAGAPDLTAAEKQILLDWFATCALPEPEGQGCDCDDPAACP